MTLMVQYYIIAQQNKSHRNNLDIVHQVRRENFGKGLTFSPANCTIAITTPFLEYNGCGSKRINFPDFPLAMANMYTFLVPVLEKAILQGIAEPAGL